MITLAGFIGNIAPPKALDKYPVDGGLVLFVNNVMVLIIIIGGLFALFNVVVAGLQYITAQGDPKAMTKVVQTLTGSLIGIVLMIGAPVIMALIGFVLFKDATFFISPKLAGP